ncbi:MAG: nucleotide-binding universal stress UspA family protein [Dasania sp.]|jgi:nucleotide-binding universal stress UspA family protein
MNKILVCLNASPNAKAIINAAGFFANLNSDFIIEILHVLKPSDNVDMIDYSAMMGMDTTGRFLDSLVDLDEKKAQVARERGEIILKNAVDYLKNHHNVSDNQIITTLKKGYFTDIVHEYEAETILTIVGKHGENSFKNGRLIGAHLEKIIRNHTKPIFVACQAFNTISKPLIAFDNSAKSHRAIDFMINYFKEQIQTLDILTVSDNEKITPEHLQAVQDKLLKYEIASDVTIGDGDIVDMIDEKITHEFYDVLFAGAYSHTQIHSFLFGSTTNNILTKTNISLFLFP